MKKGLLGKYGLWGMALLMGGMLSVGCASRGTPDYLQYDDGIRAQGSDQPSYTGEKGKPQPALINAIDQKSERTEPQEEEEPQKKGFFSFFKGMSSSNENKSETQTTSAEQTAEAETPVYRYRLKPGDSVLVTLRGAPGVDPVEDVIDENGNIKMEFLDVVPAAGKTSAELEQYIHDAYISRKIYKDISVSVILPMKSYFIRGEILKPGRFPLLSGVSIVQAVAAAGGFSEFANPKKVSIIRNGLTIPINVRDIEHNRTEDVRIEEGDVIVVHRSFL